ncbi:arginase [Halorientalis halophila]|uniref:arginase n=1 Tax=Halorientalis halophila TaxID=3108499 RepID=UPI003008E78A
MERDVRIIGVPMDLGADRRGVDMGPSAIRYAGLADAVEALGTNCTDAGDVQVPRPEEMDPDAGAPADGDAKFLAETEAVCTKLAHEIGETVAAGEFPLILGGDHSIAIGTANGISHSRETGIVWFDAHGDFNTPATTPSGNVHGMSLAALLGKGEFADSGWALAPNVPEENVALVGLRSVDEGERENIRESDVTAYTMTDIDDRGVTDVVEEALQIASDGTDGVHVSLDLDWLDPTEAPGVGTPERGGVSYREAHASMELVAECLADSDRLTSLELVEVNPILDQHNQTAELAVELAASALGKVIL